MKKIEAIIRPYALELVKDALVAHDIHGLTISEVKGYGRQHGHTEIYRGNVVEVSFVEKIKMELVIPDEKLTEVIETIINTAKTGEVGDGKIFVSTIDNVYRIRTSESGNDAI